MGSCDLRGFDDATVCRSLLEAADVLRHGAVEQLHVLRKVADVPAEFIGVPLIEARTIEA